MHVFALGLQDKYHISLLPRSRSNQYQQAHRSTWHLCRDNSSSNIIPLLVHLVRIHS